MATVSQSLRDDSGFHMFVCGLGLLFALIPLNAVHSQPELATRIEECSALSADADRLACYDKLPSGAPQAGEEPNEPPRTEAAVEPGEAAGPGADLDAGAAAEQAAEPERETRRWQLLRRLRERAARSADEADPGELSVSAGSPGAGTDEPPADEAQSGDGFEVTIVEVHRNLSGLAVFLTEDNGVWAQISTRNRAYPATPFTARISGGLMGGRFLTPASGGMAVRVRGPD